MGDTCAPAALLVRDSRQQTIAHKFGKTRGTESLGQCVCREAGESFPEGRVEVVGECASSTGGARPPWLPLLGTRTAGRREEPGDVRRGTTSHRGFCPTALRGSSATAPPTLPRAEVGMRLLPMVLQSTLPHVSLTSEVSMAMGFDYIKCLDSNITENFGQQPLHDRGQMLVGSGTFQNNPTSHIFLLAAHCRLHPSRVPGVEPRLPFEPHVHVAPTGHGAILHPCPWRLSRSALVPHPQHTARSGEPWEVLPCGRKGCLCLHMGCSATCSRGCTPPALQGPKQRPLSLVAAALVGCLPILPSLNPRPRVLAALRVRIPAGVWCFSLECPAFSVPTLSLPRLDAQ